MIARRRIPNEDTFERAPAALSGKLLLLAASLVAALTGVDALIRATDLGFRPLRGDANDDAVLERPEFRTRVRTNALGFREPRLPGPKPPGTTRIVVLGDSFTQGYGVEEHEAYPRQLEALLGEAEVINLGVPGACPLDYVAHLEEVGHAYEPDLVIVGLMANDVNDIHSVRELGVRSLPSVLRQEQDRLADPRPLWKRLPQRLWPDLYALAGVALRRLPSGGSASAAERREDGDTRPVLPPERWRDVLRAVAARYDSVEEVERRLAALPPERLERIRRVLTDHVDDAERQHPMEELMALVQPRRYNEMVQLPAAHDEAWEETTELLARIDALAERSGAETMVAYLPSGVEVCRDSHDTLARIGFERDPRTLTDTTFVDRLRAFGVEADIPVVDLLAPLRARAHESLYFPLDGHWTPRGHRAAAEALADAIERHWSS